MDNNLQKYLFLRNIYCYFSLFVTFVFTILVIKRIISFLVIINMNAIFQVLLLIPAFSILWVLVEQLWNYFKKPGSTKHLAQEPHQSRLQSLADPIINSLRLKKNVWICHDPNDLDTQAKSNFWQSEIYVGEEELRLPNIQLQAIIAHEITHIKMGDPFKLLFIEAVNWSLVIYSVILSLIAILINPSISTMYLVILLAFVVRFLCLWTERIAETTADLTATLIGYGEGLVLFMTENPSQLNFFQKLTDTHETFPKRISKIRKTLSSMQ